MDGRLHSDIILMYFCLMFLLFLATCYGNTNGQILITILAAGGPNECLVIYTHLTQGEIVEYIVYDSLNSVRFS